MNKKCIIAFSLLLYFLCGAQAEELKVFFNKDCEKAIIEEIDSAKKSIHVAIYSFTRFNIGNALARASKKGVKVQVLWDKSQLNVSEYGPKVLEIIKKAKVEVLLIEKKEKMHHKFMVIDKEKVITGSFNYTTSATNYNDENLVIFKNAKAAEKFLKAWEGIFTAANKKE